MIVDTDTLSASETETRLHNLKNAGTVIQYKGRETAGNYQIKSFVTTKDSTNWGGANFTMELQEFREAKSAYVKPTAQAQQKQVNAVNKTEPDLEIGSVVVFTGGSVYVSSDAKKAAANRGRSTCKITHINLVSWSIHPYHLKSTDGGLVEGWVDTANIEGTGTAGITADTNGGAQQVSRTSGTVYHTVKSGDTVWRLVNVNYKELGKSVQWVIDNNPSAFSRKGDATTLQIGAKLLVGYR